MHAGSDEELLVLYQQGDEAAFGELLARHRGPLYRFLLRMVNRPDIAEDLGQECFLRVVRGAANWEHRTSFKAWLYAIARNLCVDRARREHLRATESLESDQPGERGSHGDRARADGPTPEAEVERLRVRPLLAKALAALPAEQREVFLLREISDLSFPEIASVAGINENTAKSRMRYALLALRAALAGAGLGTAEEPAASAPAAGAERAGGS